MKTPNSRSEETIFSTALHCAPAERGAYLDEVCAGNPGLRQRVEELLRAQSQLGEFMESSADSFSAGTQETVRLSPRLEEGPGTRIGRYKLLQKLGEGGCGVVYMAEQQEPVHRRVALKIIKLGMDTKNVIARFEAERQALALMDHPNIAKVLDGGATEAGRPYFVMELVRGIKITDFCDQNRLSTRERIDLFIQACQAVQHAHQKGIIHRDLKPSNILVTIHDPGGPGVPMIIDFGIAKATQGRLTDQTLFTAFEQFIGTPAYMSPEQTLMTVLDVDTRSDIYSPGVLLYELLTGRTPFEARELMAAGLEEMRRTIREKEPPRPSTRLSTLLAAEQTNAASYRQTEPPKLIHLIRGDLDWIVMKAIEKDRSRRYETASAFAMDLQRHLKHEPVLACPPSRLYEFQKTVRRHKFGFGAAAVVMAALSMGIAASLWQAARASRAEREQRRMAQVAQQRSYISDMNLAQASLLEGDLGRARGLLRAQVPKPGSPDLRNWEWRYLANQCRGDELQALAGHHGYVSNVRFLDDKTLLTTGVEDMRTVLWNLQESRPTLVATNEHQGNAVGPLALAPKRGRFFYRRFWTGSSDVRTMDIRTGSDSVFCTNVAAVQALALSPDEAFLAVASGTRVDLWDIDKKRPRPGAVLTPALVNAVAFSPDGSHLAVACGDVAGTFILRNLESNTDKITKGESGWICFFSPDGRWLACGLGFGPKPALIVRKADDRSDAHALDDLAPMANASFSPDGKWLASVGGDTSVRLWDTTSWRIKCILKGHTDAVQSVAFSPNSRLLATAARNGEVKVWEAGEPPRRADSVNFFGSGDSFEAVGLVRDGSAFWHANFKPARENGQQAREGARVVSGEVWSSAPISRLGTVRLDDLILAGRCGDVSPDGRTIAIGCVDNTIHLRKLDDTNDLATGQAGNSALQSIQISMDGSVLVALCLGDHPAIHAWRLPRMELLGTRNDLKGVNQACVSDDGKSIAVFARGGSIGTLSLPSLQGAPLWGAVEDSAVWSACAFSPDDRRVAGALGSGNTYIWDLSTRSRLALPRTLTWYSSLSFSPDGSRLLASDHKALRVFDATTGQQVLALSEPELQAAFTRNGEGVLAVSPKRAFMLHAPPLEQLRFDWLAENAGPQLNAGLFGAAQIE